MNLQAPLIVIADRNVQYLALMMELVTEAGYQVLIADGGPSSYELIRTKAADLAILDMSIGEPDSVLMTLTMLRLDPTTAHIPVLICTTNTTLLRDNQAQFETMGCRVLIKPFYLATLLAMIGILLPDTP